MNAMLDFLTEYKNFVVIAHTMAMAVGVGAATVTDVFFFKFLRDLKISKLEADIMNTVSKVIWGALAVAVLSGIALYLPQAELLNTTPKFLVKVIIVAVILINGIVLTLFAGPRLARISFTLQRQEQSALTMRKVAFALGAVSMTSWYSALILGSVRSIPASFTTILLAYLVIVIVAVKISQIMERRYASRGRMV